MTVSAGALLTFSTGHIRANSLVISRRSAFLLQVNHLSHQPHSDH